MRMRAFKFGEFPAENNGLMAQINRFFQQWIFPLAFLTLAGACGIWLGAGRISARNALTIVLPLAFLIACVLLGGARVVGALFMNRNAPADHSGER